MKKRYFFCVSTGRCGTTALGLLLQKSDNFLVLNEGQVRGGGIEDLGGLEGKQVLKSMTMQNFQAYSSPDAATELLRKAREDGIKTVLDDYGRDSYLECAYYLCPFVSAIHAVFPEARILYLYRDGRNFVRDAYTKERPDPAPVGYLDEYELSPVERYVSLGRLRPVKGEAFSDQWEQMSPFEKNVWLWAETNRIVIEQLNNIPEKLVLRMPMEQMFSVKGMQQVLDFFQPEGLNGSDLETTVTKKVNVRKSYVIPKWEDWGCGLKAQFKSIGQEMMMNLGYVSDDRW